MHRKLGLLLASSALAGMAACAQLPHNNVLLFGTDTKVALDISSSATSGGAPQITIGYRRAEAAWMPLVINDTDCPDDFKEPCRFKTAKKTIRRTLANGDVVTELEPIKYTGTTKVETTKGDDRIVTTTTDSYSVFASFGAKFSGSAGAADVQGSGGLAQFFATGVAAQKLAGNPNVEAALKVNNPGAASGEAEKAQAEVAILEKKIALSEAEIAKNKEKEKAIALNSNLIAKNIVATCGGPEAGEAKWKSALGKSGITLDGQQAILTRKKNTQAIEIIASNSAFYETFERNLKTACP